MLRLTRARVARVCCSPGKSELLYFSRKCETPLNTVTLDSSDPTGAVTPSPAAYDRFLGIWPDRKLLFQAHTDQSLRKLKTQRCALIRLTAQT